MSRLNIYADQPWNDRFERMKIRSRVLGQPLGAKALGATLYELMPDSPGFNLHAHYGMEELFIVLSGHPKLRTGDGEQPLEPGDVVFCPPGMEGLHTFNNPTEQPVRLLAMSNNVTPEVVVYPELGKFGVATRDPLESPPDGADAGIMGLFDLPQSG